MPSISLTSSAPPFRHTILRPFPTTDKNIINPDAFRQVKQGSLSSLKHLIAGGAYRIIVECVVEYGEPPKHLQSGGDVAIAHDTGDMLLFDGQNWIKGANPLLQNQNVCDSRLKPEHSYKVRFSTRAVSTLAGILCENTDIPPLVILESARHGGAFETTGRHLNRIAIQAIDEAGSMNHLIETGQREPWMSLRFNDIITQITID